ncbi:sugar-transfer associated ATP-grasp domain-containing protein [Lentibacillus salinarum]|uniref:Sugar-transfer associated ATP-grasp domain-containing protein n=1 Tax=Lentibacillus salinarum TaxID=446820 RepID=A0ABW3ZWU6_9BACI
MIKLLKNARCNLIALRYLLEQEKNNNSNPNLGKKAWCLIQGFSSDKYGLYNFEKNNYKLYLSDFKRRKTAKINGPYSLIINDKNLFSKIFLEHNVTAETYGKVKNGKIILNNRSCTLDEFCGFVVEQKKLIIKKFSGGGGKGIYRLTYENDNFYLDYNSITSDTLKEFVRTLPNHLIVEHLSQAAYSNKIYSGTINSIRIITMRDPETDKVFIPVAVHKFGSEKTKPVDNVWKGGMTALVDLEKGRLGKAAYHQENNSKIEWVQTHPDTNVKIEGTVIPNWEHVKNKVIEVAKSEDNLRYVGWDVVVTDTGMKIIEGNNYSDVNILQIHQPLLKDERVRKFYKYYGII